MTSAASKSILFIQFNAPPYANITAQVPCGRLFMHRLMHRKSVQAAHFPNEPPVYFLFIEKGVAHLWK